MHVILTHEQADFDAIGALLGASLLHEGAFAVLPRKVNRNVRAFLNIYAQDLPFTEPDDLSGSPVEIVTLVDTQSLVTLKGVSANTKIQVIDHHLKPALPDDWTVHLDPVGACTTLMVEALIEQNEHLTTLQATLMLLGIYEDTGSLTYASTTPRDVRAAAALLEMGASLRTAVDYLNPTLSPAQRSLYDHLLKNVQTHTIHGKTILIAQADARELSEEISSIAHKLRDLLDPDALFLFIRTAEGIRMIARSTSDSINVAKIALAYGGGGHERAAAALFQPPQGTSPDDPAALDQAVQKLLDMLPGMVVPSITVAQLMSRNPLLITPETTAEEASSLMRRFGYEGYPVVADGKVVGLLTRRAVDRSLSHQMNLPAHRLMEAGEVTVTSQDTLDDLHRRMADSGWGQIPVIDPDSHAIIGIVTRTDLVKALAAGEARMPGRLNLAEKLTTSLTPTRLAFLQFLADLAASQHIPIYIVGGFVRDLLLNRPSLDFDVVVEGDAIQLARAAAETGGDVVSHSRFGTAKWRITKARAQVAAHLPKGCQVVDELPETLDFISSRTEFYDYPTALPTVSRSSIKLDLHRRDFTINTMALRLDGHHFGDLYDYWGGLNDLHKGLVRVLHSLSFIDDPTRMLRAVRFEQRFNFTIEPRTLELIGEALPVIKPVSGDRLRHEFNLLLSEPHPSYGLTRLHELGLLVAIHPALAWDKQRASALDQCLLPPDERWGLPAQMGSLPIQTALAYLVWLAQLNSVEAASGADRLRFPATLKSALVDACNAMAWLTDGQKRQAAEWVKLMDKTARVSLCALSLLRLSSDANQILENYLNIWQYIQPHTTIAELERMGIPRGPGYRSLMGQLRDAWLNGALHSQDEEKQLLSQLIQHLPPSEGANGDNAS